MMLGDLPTGYEAYPEAVGLVLGIICVCSIAYLLSAPVDGTQSDAFTNAVTFLYSKFSVISGAAKESESGGTLSPVHNHKE